MESEKISENIKAIVFDVGGVLQIGGKPRIDPHSVHTSGVHEYIANKLKLSLDQYFDSIDTIYAKSIEGQTTKSILLGTLACNLNYPKEKLEKLYFNFYKRQYKRNKWLFNVIKKLRQKGYKVGVLSDQWHLSKDALIPEKDRKLFDKVVISCEVGMRKPNPEIYKMILAELKVKPSETLFVDNQVWNLVPANKFGMKTILYVDNKKTKEQLDYFGIYV